MSAKLVVTNARGGSRITLVGTSGTDLLTSKVFSEPRGKGATLRSLKGLLGEDVIVEDRTADVEPKAPVVAATIAPKTKRTARATTKPARTTRRKVAATK